MKKLLLFALALCGVAVINAMEPLTAEQLSKLTVNVSNYTDNTFGLSSKVSLEYADETNPNLLQIQNFIGSGLPLRVNVDWETGTLAVFPSTFDQEFNEDDYQTYYLMVVSEEASNLSSPMDDAFLSSKVTGKISESGLTLDPWNIVVASPNFTSMTKKYDKAMTTEIVASNATMTLQLRDVNWDKEDPDTYICPIEDTELIEFDTYVKQEGTDVYVYNWDEMASCVKLTQKELDGTYTYTTHADDFVYIRNARYQYGIYFFDEETDENLYNVEATSLESEPVVNADELNFGYWIIYALERKSERTMGRFARLKLSFNLNLGTTTTGIDDCATPEVPIKVVYYNLNGVRTANPADGIFVEVATYADGTVKTSKVMK